MNPSGFYVDPIFRSGERFEIVLQGTAKGTLYLMLRVII